MRLSPSLSNRVSLYPPLPRDSPTNGYRHVLYEILEVSVTSTGRSESWNECDLRFDATLMLMGPHRGGCLIFHDLERIIGFVFLFFGIREYI